MSGEWIPRGNELGEAKPKASLWGSNFWLLFLHSRRCRPPRAATSSARRHTPSASRFRRRRRRRRLVLATLSIPSCDNLFRTCAASSLHNTRTPEQNQQPQTENEARYSSDRARSRWSILFSWFSLLRPLSQPLTGERKVYTVMATRSGIVWGLSRLVFGVGAGVMKQELFG